MTESAKEHQGEKDGVGERVIRDVETHAAECRNALNKTLTGYFVPIDQWRALRSLLRTIPPVSLPCWFCSHIHTEPTICRAVAIDGGPCVCTKDPAIPPGSTEGGEQA